MRKWFIADPLTLVDEMRPLPDSQRRCRTGALAWSRFVTEPEVPDRSELRQLILIVRWETGELTFYQAVEEAESIEDRLWSKIEVGPEFPATDARSIAVEVVGLFSMGYVQPLFVEDIPHILDLLAASAGREERALNTFWQYFDSLDYDERARRAEALYRPSPESAG